MPSPFFQFRRFRSLNTVLLQLPFFCPPNLVPQSRSRRIIGSTAKLHSCLRRGAKMSIYDMKVLSEELLSNEDSRWLKLQKVKYRDPQGVVRDYERVRRCTRPENSRVDAASVIAIMVKKKKGEKESSGGDKASVAKDDDGDDDGLEYPRVVIEKQFRPPVGKISVEFPAGLVDKDETVEQCAIRELKEETGYVGTVCTDWSLPEVCTDAGLGGTMLQHVVIEIDMNSPENKKPMAALEESEFMEVTSLPLRNLKAHLDELAKDERCVLDARVSLFAEGLEMAKRATERYGL